eukprot:TRINITY_DN863_c0_g1_i1.p1 TRINITY_DN863_c0_g1~~TRINITY_DN863_c0_g1_i1.p1  ORF type:complete len:209 (-),score=28.05 TRINITY_DN863_c0_g1_i1:1272-1898(-)
MTTSSAGKPTAKSKNNDGLIVNHFVEEKIWHSKASKWVKKETHQWNTTYFFEVFDPLNQDHFDAMSNFTSKVNGVYYGELFYNQCILVFMACKEVIPGKTFEIASVVSIEIVQPIKNLSVQDKWDTVKFYSQKKRYPSEFTTTKTIKKKFNYFLAFQFAKVYKDELNVDGIVSYCVENPLENGADISLKMLVTKFAFVYLFLFCILIT